MHGCIGFQVGQAVGYDWRSSDKVSDVLAEWPPAPATDEDTEASFPLNGKQRLVMISRLAMALRVGLLAAFHISEVDPAAIKP